MKTLQLSPAAWGEKQGGRVWNCRSNSLSMHEKYPTAIGALPIQFYTWFLYLPSIQIQHNLTKPYSRRTHIPLVWKATVILWHHHPSAPFLLKHPWVSLAAVTYPRCQARGRSQCSVGGAGMLMSPQESGGVLFSSEWVLSSSLQWPGVL